jgi:eukaryotic-like serine/threonine-protein kinase
LIQPRTDLHLLGYNPATMSLTAGTKLGPYEIVSLLGAGGMGEVYRARDSRLKREVAVKVLPRALSADAERLRRFEQEALATAALNHPNILAVFDIGTNEGAPYVVSELLEGETLRERLRSGAIPVRKTLDYAMQIARGLAAAHEKGIVHRDLKPENLFLTKDGRVKILDFGLAKLTQPESGDQASATMTHATEAGVVMGTAGYMSPEQVRGAAVGPRSDIFSFGTILYEMVSGKRAFHRETPADTMSAILKEEPADLSETNRNVSPALERIVHHCLEKNPEQRFHSASDIAFDLEHLSGTSTASTSGKMAAIPGETPKSKLPVAVAVGLVLALAMLAVGWRIGKGSGVAPIPQYKQVTFRTGSIGKARFTPDGSVVYSAAWDGGEDQLYLSRTDEPGARELGLKNAELLSISKKGELALRLNTVNYGNYARAGTLARLPLSGGTPREVLDNVQDADWAPDGENMAIVRVDPGSLHWRLEYPVGKVLFETIAWISHPKISPDGKWIAFADHEIPGGDDQGTVAVISTDGKGKEKKLSTGWLSLEGILWSPAGDEIWFTSTNTGSATNPHAVTLDGKLRSVANVPGGVWLEDRRNDTVLMITHRQRVGIRGIAPGQKEEHELGWFGWSIIAGMTPDGRKIAFVESGDGGGPNYTVFVRDTDGSPPARIGEGNCDGISPDAKWVVTNPARGGPLSLVPTGAGEARQFTHDSVSYRGVVWMHDGKHVLAQGIESGHSPRTYMIDLGTGESKPITPDGVSGTLLSPDGKSIAVYGSDGKLAIWPLDGSGIRPIPGLDSSYYATRWSPDGLSLYVASSRVQEKLAKVYVLNVTTGKMELWKTFGENVAGMAGAGAPLFSTDGSAYAYGYSSVLSEAYVVTGLK